MAPSRLDLREFAEHSGIKYVGDISVPAIARAVGKLVFPDSRRTTLEVVEFVRLGSDDIPQLQRLCGCLKNSQLNVAILISGSSDETDVFVFF